MFLPPWTLKGGDWCYRQFMYRHFVFIFQLTKFPYCCWLAFLYTVNALSYIIQAWPVWLPEDIEWFIVDQAFSQEYDSAFTPPPLLSTSCPSFSVSSRASWRERGEEWGRSHILQRRRESLVLYKSFNTLWWLRCLQTFIQHLVSFLVSPSFFISITGLQWSLWHFLIFLIADPKDWLSSDTVYPVLVLLQNVASRNVNII